MKKDELKKLIEKYQFAEQQVTKLDDEFGIRLWDSNKPNFYNEYNYIIFNLLEQIYGEANRILIEDYIFEQNSITFDELWNSLNE